MSQLLAKSRYLVLIGVLFSLLASVAAFLWGAAKTVDIVVKLATSLGQYPGASVSLIELMDAFLIATALFMVSVGLYELFVEDVPGPAWLVFHNLHDLKVKLSGVVILVMAVTFLEHLIEWKDAQATLFFGIAVAIVSAALIAFGYWGEKDKESA